MKNYYFNPKTQDLMIFDSTTNEIDVLEVLKGIRVITSSEIRNGSEDEPAKHWKNAMWNAKDGKAELDYGKSRKSDEKQKTKAAKPKPEKASKTKGKWTCKNCGEKGHGAKTCPKPPKVEQPAAPERLPDSEIDQIAREERAVDPLPQ